MMYNFASDETAASSAITGLTSVSVNKSQEASVPQSTIKSMKKGEEVSNQILSDLSELVRCVNLQSEKFPQIAEIISIRDSKVKF